MRTDPLITFLVILAIGIAAGFIFERFAGRSWLSRQIAGQTRSLVTGALIGIAGSFIGYHLALLLRLTGTIVPFLIAAVGAAVVLWGWRMAR
jgi:hypothetical protein